MFGITLKRNEEINNIVKNFSKYLGKKLKVNYALFNYSKINKSMILIELKMHFTQKELPICLKVHY